MVLFFFISHGLAWDVSTSGPFGPSEPEDVVTIYVGERPVLAVLTRTTTYLLSAQTGEEIDRVTTDALGLAVVDVDQDGQAELIVCNRVGPLDVWSVGPGLQASSRTADEAACFGALHLTDSEILLSETRLARYRSSPDGLILDRVVPTPESFVARRMAVSGEHVVAIDPFEPSRRYLGEWSGLSPLTLDHDFQDVAGGSLGLWAAGSAGLHNLLTDPNVALAPEGLASIALMDVDGDGVDDVALGGRDGLWIELQPSGPANNRRIDGMGSRLVSIDLDGEGCASVVALSSDGVYVHRIVDCHGDADGDGFSSDDGDCDDADDETNPDADERCDEVDHDCDGAFADVPFAYDLPSVMDEGSALPEIAYCGLMSTPQVSIDPVPPLECQGDPCGIGDDGTVVVTVRADGFPELDVVHSVTVLNVAPQLLHPVDDLGVPVITLFTDGVGQVEFWDPVDHDDVVVSVVDGPRWLEILPDGTVTSSAPKQGEWDAVLRLDDQDGGVTEVNVALVATQEGGRGCGVSCAGGGGCDPDISCSTTSLPLSAGGFGGLLLLLLRRRRK